MPANHWTETRRRSTKPEAPPSTDSGGSLPSSKVSAGLDRWAPRSLVCSNPPSPCALDRRWPPDPAFASTSPRNRPERCRGPRSHVNHRGPGGRLTPGFGVRGADRLPAANHPCAGTYRTPCEYGFCAARLSFCHTAHPLSPCFNEAPPPPVRSAVPGFSVAKSLIFSVDTGTSFPLYTTHRRRPPRFAAMTRL